MILDDLFEQKPLPPHIKSSDLPPGMRQRLTMRDIEKERPRGAYRYRVTPGKPGESPKDFLDLPGAEQYAQATGGRVQPLAEQVSDPDIQRGIENLDTLERNATNDLPVEIQNETGRAEYQIQKARDKQWVINHAKEWVDAGRGNDLYRYMGNTRGFEFLLAAWQKEDAYRSAQSKRAKFEPEADTTPDLYGTQARGAPRAPRYQDESVRSQKKTSDLGEAPQGARGRTERMMAQMRARQPQATSDVEALAYELADAERRDSEEIDKLERDVDNLETDIKGELQKRIATLTRRKGGIQQAAAADTKIDSTLDQLTRVNDQQQRDIDTLNKAVANLGQRSTTASAPAVPDTSTRTATAVSTAAPGIEIPYTPRSKPTAPQASDPYTGAVTGLIGQMQRPAELSPTDQAPDKEQEKSAAGRQEQPSGEQRPQDLPSGELTRVGGIDPSQWKKVANLKEQEKDIIDRLRGAYRKTKDQPASAAGEQDLVDKIRGTALGRTVEPVVRKAGKAIAQTGLGQTIGDELGMARDAWRLAKKMVLPTRRPAAVTTAPVAVPTEPAPAAAPVQVAEPTAPSPIIQPASYGRPRSGQQQTAMQDLVKQAKSLTPAQKAAAVPDGWQPGQPIRLGKQVITPRDPNYQTIAALLARQQVQEKKKPVPTNPDLWSRAKSAARSKFDVYPSAYANAWAAKWYKSKGGGWRMGKPKKK